jgi:hypothetical protein
MLIDITPKQLQLAADIAFDEGDRLMAKMDSGEIDSRNEYRRVEKRYNEVTELLQRLSEQRKRYVVEYTLTREYGGPEEGGWYYDAYTMVRVAAECEDEATAIDVKEALQSLVDDERPYHSVLSTGVTRYIVDDAPGEMERPTPVYE